MINVVERVSTILRINSGSRCSISCIRKEIDSIKESVDYCCMLDSTLKGWGG